MHDVFNLLCAQALLTDIKRLALGAFVRGLAHLGAKVAAELTVRAVESHGDAAMLAGRDVAAIRTEDTGGKPAAIKKEDALLFLFEAVDQLVRERSRNGRSPLALQRFSAHVDKVNLRQLTVIDAVEDFIDAIFAAFHIV